MSAVTTETAIPRFHALVGTGGIGSGLVFALNGDHLLGREESRSGRFLKRDDYCKLHIISHYVGALMDNGFRVIPVGAVGDDAAGQRLRSEMEAAGLEMACVRQIPDASTLFCICFTYPDGTGGNLTTDDSASARVTPAEAEWAVTTFSESGKPAIALAVPEVPLATRVALLQASTRAGFFRAASFTSDEMAAVRSQDLLRGVDLLAVNQDEARQLLSRPEAGSTADVVERLARWTGENYPPLAVSLTAGAAGSWTMAGSEVRFLPGIPVEVASTGGAGDAHFSGILAGLSAGLTLADAQQVGQLCGAMSVTSPHAIHKGISRAALHGFADQHQVQLHPAVSRFLTPCL